MILFHFQPLINTLLAQQWDGLCQLNDPKHTCHPSLPTPVWTITFSNVHTRVLFLAGNRRLLGSIIIVNSLKSGLFGKKMPIYCAVFEQVAHWKSTV